MTGGLLLPGQRLVHPLRRRQATSFFRSRRAPSGCPCHCSTTTRRDHAGDGDKARRHRFAICRCHDRLKDGKPFDGGKTYKVQLPPNMPAKDFWSFVVYDNQTRSMLQTDQQFPSIGSDKKDIVIKRGLLGRCVVRPESAGRP